MLSRRICNDAQAEYSHAADIDRRKHEEELVAEIRLERRGDLGHNEVEQPLRGTRCRKTVMPSASGEDISHIYPPVSRIKL